MVRRLARRHDCCYATKWVIITSTLCPIRLLFVWDITITSALDCMSYTNQSSSSHRCLYRHQWDKLGGKNYLLDIMHWCLWQKITLLNVTISFTFERIRLTGVFFGNSHKPNNTAFRIQSFITKFVNSPVAQLAEYRIEYLQFVVKKLSKFSKHEWLSLFLLVLVVVIVVTV